MPKPHLRTKARLSLTEDRLTLHDLINVWGGDWTPDDLRDSDVIRSYDNLRAFYFNYREQFNTLKTPDNWKDRDRNYYHPPGFRWPYWWRFEAPAAYDETLSQRNQLATLGVLTADELALIKQFDPQSPWDYDRKLSNLRNNQKPNHNPLPPAA